jgi:hypothetical protein
LHFFTLEYFTPQNTPRDTDSPCTMDSSLSSSQPASIVYDNPHTQNPHAIFQPFSRLPRELRRKIWSHYLEDSIPLMYNFTLRYPQRFRRWNGKNSIRKGDKLFLQPTECIKGPAGARIRADFLNLREAMKTRHIASAICVESRQVVVELFPHTLKFRNLSMGWGKEMAHKGLGKLNGSPFLEHILRFNGARDIIIFDVDWADQESAIKIAALGGSVHDSFLKMRHVGIAIDKLRNTTDGVLPFKYGTRACRTGCQTEECRDCCTKEPLPKFLGLFPLLETFYIAQVLSSSENQQGDQTRTSFPLVGATCPCPTSGLRHSWPVMRNSDTCGWSTIYDERSGCLLPKLNRVEELRQHWRPHFPYYRALDHLEIRFIQSSE